MSYYNRPLNTDPKPDRLLYHEGMSVIAPDEEGMFRYVYDSVRLDLTSHVDDRVAHASARLVEGAVALDMPTGVTSVDARRYDLIKAEMATATDREAKLSSLRHIGVVAIAA
jgi:hypothetical protein